MLKKDYIFKEAGDVSIAATAFWKPADTGLPYGIALAFHGGGFVMGSRYFIPEVEIEYLCDAHFVVVSADYRLCPQVALRDVIQDAIDAFSWCKLNLPAKLNHDAGIEIDAEKIVAFGQSAGALLALHLGGLPEPPRAILDFYGVKYTSDEFWHTPLPLLAGLPPFEQSFLQKIHEGPVLTTTVTSLERATASSSKTKKRGLPAPDLSFPRNAWLFTALKNGTHMKAIAKDDNFEGVDPTLAFKPGFPPTFFVHGDADDIIPARFSEKAFNHLSSHGVKTELSLVPNQSHGFDAGLSQEDSEWPPVRRALDWLIMNGNK
ncbi:Alpha/Beta hydrolase protein [Ilyonectria sp. MPI-CAGE-AT-0026]|nr:Alpha/Beta hydrolase protein [Ilyonectria sp. MPI-CAGE-AT-0026]